MTALRDQSRDGMETKVLKSKPLVEALLEIKWRSATQQGTTSVDPNYRLFVGRFYDRVRERYPVFEPLQTAAIPEEMATHMVQYRFRMRENGYPLLQVGPGLLTLNTTESYTWDEFEKEADWALPILLATFPSNLQFHSLTLRYIDAVEVDFSKEDILSFLRDKLKVEINFPESLFDGSRVERLPTAFVMQSSFKSREPTGTVQVKFARGTLREKNVLLWETLVSSTDAELPELPKGFSEWLSSAHAITEEWFFKLIDGELLRQFE
jgi:uncharacterized protein (TIGR04255 family)